MLDAVHALLTATFNEISVWQVAVLFVLARGGLVILRWIGRVLLFGFYVVASALLTWRWVVWLCAYLLYRWQIDLGEVVFGLHDDHLEIKATVVGRSSDSATQVHLKMTHPRSGLSPAWHDAAPYGSHIDHDWETWVNRHDRRTTYRNALHYELKRLTRFPQA